MECSHEMYFSYLIDGRAQMGLLGVHYSNMQITLILKGGVSMNVNVSLCHFVDETGAKEWAYYKFEFNYQHSISQILIQVQLLRFSSLFDFASLEAVHVHGLAVQVNPSNGDPDLYVDIDIDIDLNNASCTDPTTCGGTDPTAWRFHSTQYGSDHIRLSPSDYEALCDVDPSGDPFCTIDVAIFGWSASVYTLMVSTNSIAVFLRNGKPNTGYISYDTAEASPRAYSYFLFDIENMNDVLMDNNITISMTPLVQTTSDNSIETVFYVDGDLNPSPSASVHKWESDDFQHPFLIIDGQAILDDDTVNNELYIAVTSNQNLTFTLTLTVGSVIQLQDGQYQVGHVRAWHSNHYELIIDGEDKENQDIEVLLNTFHGNVNLYVSSRVEPLDGIA